MPWKCPACATQVRHPDAEPMPRLGALYRCPACRIDLVVDAVTSKMKVAPIAAAADGRQTPVRKRRTRAN